MAAFLPAGANIAHERVDNEVIAINLSTGAYFSLPGTAADCWTLLAAATPVDAVAEAVADRYGADREIVEHDLAALLSQLVAEGLLAATPPATDAAAVLLPEAIKALVYRAPTLEKYDDMEELLLLDPIHEVDEAGWPLVPSEPD